MSGPVSMAHEWQAGIREGRGALMAAQNRSTRAPEYNGTTSQNGIDGGTQPSKPFGSAFSSASTTTNSWSGSGVWGNNKPLMGLAAPTRDRSDRSSIQERNNSSLSDNDPEYIEGKTGSKALLDSSETDRHWPGRKPWPDHTSVSATRRSSGVSPARQRPAQKQHSAMNDAHSPNILNHTRAGGFGHETYRTGSLSLDVFNMPNGDQDVDGNIDRAYPYMTQRSQSLIPGYSDPNAVHSPTDDRRSVANSEYFGSSSAAASRNGSLPPSRHGNEPSLFSQPSDGFSRFMSSQGTPTRIGHNSVLPTQPLRANQTRTPSFPNDTTPLFERMSLMNPGADGRNAQHRSSVSNASMSAYSTQASSERNVHSQNGFVDEDQTYSGSVPSLQAHTPEGLSIGQLAGTYGSHTLPRYGAGAMTPSSSGINSSPYYTAASTPPLPNGTHVPQGHNNHARSVSNNAYLESRLRNIAQQEAQGYMNPQFPAYGAMRYANGYGQIPFQIPNMNPYTQISGPISLHNMTMMPNDGPRGRREHDASFGVRSTVLDEFKNNNKGRRWTLKDIMDHIVEFAGDQYGSRFIQSKLETANSDEKEAVYRQLQENALQLMQDVFGNYVIQKFFEHGDQVQKELLAKKMKRKVFDLSKQMYGCRVVQKALEYVLVDQQASLVKELEGQGLVMILVKDQNGNHVIQKAIECVPAEHIQFIYNTFRGQVGHLATHTYGCRVIQRMLENCTGPERVWMMEELRSCAANLIQDQYGNYVTQHIIEHGEMEHRNYVIGLVTRDLSRNSTHKFASNVVEKCLVFGTSEQKRIIMHTLLDPTPLGGSRDTTLQSLINDQYGNYVIQKMQDNLERPEYDTLCEALHTEILKAKRAGRGGKQIQAIEKRMHRFDTDSLDQSHVARTSPPQIGLDSVRSPAQIHVDSTQASGAASPPPPLLTDTQSLRSDSIPSTTVSAGEERGTGTILGLEKLRPTEIPQIGITDASE